MSAIRSAAIFCRVVDNFGDIGVSWRLARQLAHEHGLKVKLWVDDLASFQKICPRIDPCLERQREGGVDIAHWNEKIGMFFPEDVPDLIIEAFGCKLPDNYLAAMAARARPPAWINLEYLSAEKWVEDCHALPSPHPFLPLTKYFFFPGFATRTGGLLCEHDLFASREYFQSDAQAGEKFLSHLGVPVFEHACKLSLFCYPGAPVSALFAALQASNTPVICLVPEGVAAEAVGAFLGKPARVGARAARANLTVQILPFLEQPDYDKLLWSCDLNFVRGEDSAVRAQWAARPFIWQIYPQEQHAHHAKLDAFLERYISGMPGSLALTVKTAWHAWNGISADALDWPSLERALPELAVHTAQWARNVVQHGDLATKLIEFAEKIS